jgi:hypothetical protein
MRHVPEATRDSDRDACCLLPRTFSVIHVADNFHYGCHVVVHGIPGTA